MTATLVEDGDRIDTLPRILGPYFLNFENMVYTLMDNYAENYKGAYWEFYTLSNGGFYMAPRLKEPLKIDVEGNGFSGELSPDAAGVFICLMAFNQYAWRTEDERFNKLFDDLRSFALGHAESSIIFRAID